MQRLRCTVPAQAIFSAQGIPPEILSEFLPPFRQGGLSLIFRKVLHQSKGEENLMKFVSVGCSIYDAPQTSQAMSPAQGIPPEILSEFLPPFRQGGLSLIFRKVLHQSKGEENLMKFVSVGCSIYDAPQTSQAMSPAQGIPPEILSEFLPPFRQGGLSFIFRKVLHPIKGEENLMRFVWHKSFLGGRVLCVRNRPRKAM